MVNETSSILICFRLLKINLTLLYCTGCKLLLNVFFKIHTFSRPAQNLPCT